MNHGGDMGSMASFYTQVPLGNPVMGAGIPSSNPLDQTYGSGSISSASSYANLSYLFGVQDPAMAAPKGAKGRRRSAPGAEHVKHRRTRSGCYTCRSRRVKCDEAHPICERCKKGNRDCAYPEKKATAKSGSNKPGQPAKQDAQDSSTDGEDDEDETERLDTIPDVDEGMDEGTGTEGMNSASRHGSTSQGVRGDSETPSLIHDKGTSPTPSTEGSTGYSGYSLGAAADTRTMRSRSQDSSEGLRNKWSHLPKDLQFYLAYFCDNLTYNHYALKHDSGDFLRTHLLDAALRNDPLLYAVVGFSAFQYTLTNPRGQIQDFLQYYNKAVSLLLNRLKKGVRHNVGILLTMLQLATIEEYLGDWVNLLGHQRAAYEILTELYTPQTMMESELTRMLLGWYTRFDVFASLMGGFETVLSRDWFSYAQEYLRNRVAEEPNDVNWKIEAVIVDIRLIAMDMSILLSRKKNGEIPHEDFLRENELLTKRIADWKVKMDPALQDPRWRVTDFTGAPPPDPNDIVDPYIPGTLYYGPLWSMSEATMSYYAMTLMHQYQTALILGNQPSKELAMTAYAVCQLFESVEYWPGSPQGAIVAFQASLAIASLFLPRDKQHSMWCRRKLAVVESHGYVYPLTFRTKMAALFGDQSCMHWWLPNDESYPPMIRSIRKFVEERTSAARDVPTEDLRDMKAIFEKLKLDDGKTHIPTQRGKNMIPPAQVAVANDENGAGYGAMESEVTGAYLQGSQESWGP